MVLSKVCYLQVISPFFAITFFSIMIQIREISMQVRKISKYMWLRNSACGSLYFWSYTPWKIGLVASPETSQNQVFRVKTS
jgi:hypothetical protein